MGWVPSSRHLIEQTLVSCTVCVSDPVTHYRVRYARRLVAILRSLFSLHCFADLVFGPLHVYLCNSEKLQKFVFPPCLPGAQVRVARSGYP